MLVKADRALNARHGVLCSTATPAFEDVRCFDIGRRL